MSALFLFVSLQFAGVLAAPMGYVVSIEDEYVCAHYERNQDAALRRFRKAWRIRQALEVSHVGEWTYGSRRKRHTTPLIALRCPHGSNYTVFVLVKPRSEFARLKKAAMPRFVCEFAGTVLKRVRGSDGRWRSVRLTDERVSGRPTYALD